MKIYVMSGALMAALLCSSVGVQASIEDPNLSEYFYLGEYYMHTGQLDQAISNYTSMAAKHPNSREAQGGWLNTGTSYYMLMQQEIANLDALKAKGEATEAQIKQVEAKINSYMNQGVAAYKKALAQFPRVKAEAIIGIGLIYAALGDSKLDAALTELKQVVDNYPEEAGWAQTLVGDSYAKAGNVEAAKEAYLTASLKFPEVASLALSKYAGLNSDAAKFAEAADNYSRIIGSLGIDNAYSPKYHPLGTVMQEAVKKRGETERALENEEDELDGFTAVAAHYYGTNVGMYASVDLARALWHYGRTEEAGTILKGISTDYPKSVWAVRALLELAELQGATQAAIDTYKVIAASYPKSIYWVEAQMGLSKAYLELAKKEEDYDTKVQLKADAAKAAKAVDAMYPLCPEGESARNFITSNKLPE